MITPKLFTTHRDLAPILLHETRSDNLTFNFGINEANYKFDCGIPVWKRKNFQNYFTACINRTRRTMILPPNPTYVGSTEHLENEWCTKIGCRPVVPQPNTAKLVQDYFDAKRWPYPTEAQRLVLQTDRPFNFYGARRGGKIDWVREQWMKERKPEPEMVIWFDEWYIPLCFRTHLPKPRIYQLTSKNPEKRAKRWTIAQGKEVTWRGPSFEAAIQELNRRTTKE